MTLRRLIDSLKTPSQFDGDPYGGLTNQWGHYTLGAAVMILTCAAWFFAFGEMPPRYWAAGALVLVYAVLIEWRAQGWRGRDSAEDTLFTAMGILTVASSAREVEVAGRQSIVVVDVVNVTGCILAAALAVIVYAVRRAR